MLSVPNCKCDFVGCLQFLGKDQFNLLVLAEFAVSGGKGGGGELMLIRF